MDYKVEKKSYYKIIDDKGNVIYGSLDVQNVLTTKYEVEWITEQEYLANVDEDVVKY